MRLYQPVWEKLKTDRLLVLTAPPHMHKRIIKAVRKEKGEDLAYKFLCAEDKSNYNLVTLSSGSKLQLKLVSAKPQSPRYTSLNI